MSEFNVNDLYMIRTLVDAQIEQQEKKSNSQKIAISGRIDRLTKCKINEVITAIKIVDPDSTLSFNEVLNTALEEWILKEENITLRDKFNQIRKNSQKGDY